MKSILLLNDGLAGDIVPAMRLRLLTLTLVAGMVVASAWAQAEEGAGSASAPKAAEKAKGAPDKPVIGLGMTPEEVVKVIGKPDEKAAVETPAGKGEEWKYRRLAKKWTQQTAATVDVVPAFVGLAMPNQGIGEASSASQRLERIEVYQVSNLLFIDGKLAAAKQWQEKVSQIEN